VETTASGIEFLVIFVIMLALMILVIVSTWKVYTKAGQPGWASIVPFYNVYVLLKIVGRPGWWLALLLVPIVNLVILIIVYVDLARSFGKGGGFAVLMIFLPFIAFPILAWGNATYRGPTAAPDVVTYGPTGRYAEPGYPPPPDFSPPPGYQPPQGYQPPYPSQQHPPQPTSGQQYPPE
jgi:Family of unknown function (DUF5684)